MALLELHVKKICELEGDEIQLLIDKVAEACGVADATRVHAPDVGDFDDDTDVDPFKR